MIRGVVLDMDGTLCDTEVIWRDVGMAVAQELGAELSLEQYLSCVGVPGPIGRARLAEAVSADFPREAWFALTDERAIAQCDQGVALKPGAIELLDLLDDLALPYAVCTSSTPAAVTRHLGPLTARLHGVVAQGSYVQGKPHPEPFLNAASMLGVDPSACLATGVTIVSMPAPAAMSACQPLATSTCPAARKSAK